MVNVTRPLLLQRQPSRLGLDIPPIFAVRMASTLPALGKERMRVASRFLSAGVIFVFLLSFSSVAQTSPDSQQPPSSSPASSSPAWYNPARYNPLKLIHRHPKSASDQLASDEELERKLTTQLQAHGALAQDANLQDACSSFTALADCLAALRASHDLQIEFACLKWDVTGVKPHSVSDSCAGPSDRKAMSFRNSIALLKPGCNATEVAANVQRAARDDIKDASS